MTCGHGTRQHGVPILYVTHSREEVFALGDRVIVLENGRVIAQGTPHQVMSAPRLETVAQLAGFENIFDATVIAVHEDRGTMVCQLSGSQVEIETPLVRADVGSELRVGIRAGDILLASLPPVGLSARNIIPGRVVSLAQRDVIVVAKVNCGVEMEVHLTLAAREALHLQPGSEVWLVVKTHSCHLMGFRSAGVPPAVRRASRPPHMLPKTGGQSPPIGPAGRRRYKTKSPVAERRGFSEITKSYTLNDDPQPQVLFTFGFSNLKPAPSRVST